MLNPVKTNKATESLKFLNSITSPNFRTLLYSRIYDDSNVFESIALVFEYVKHGGKGRYMYPYLPVPFCSVFRNVFKALFLGIIKLVIVWQRVSPSPKSNFPTSKLDCDHSQ